MSQIHFADYFPDTYHRHLRRFYASLPEGILRHEDVRRQGIPCIQFPYLAGMVDATYLDFLSDAEIPHFGVALRLLCEKRGCGFEHREVLRESRDPMRAHITTLIATHGLRVDPDAFWAKCRGHV